MLARIVTLVSAAAVALAAVLSAPAPQSALGAPPAAMANGIVTVKSAYAMDETIARLKQDIAAKGITFFTQVDQAKLAAEAGIKLRPSTLLMFGNPGLGAHFMTSNPQSGIDWPVRLLVVEDDKGDVWTVYTDFAYIAERHGIKDRDEQFKMASGVIASITSSVAAK